LFNQIPVARQAGRNPRWNDEDSRPDLCSHPFEVPGRRSLHAFVLVDSQVCQEASSSPRRRLRWFSLAPRMLTLIEIVIVLLLAFTGLTIFEAVRKGEGLIAALIPLSVLAAILLAKPRPVSTNSERRPSAPLVSWRQAY
jgi:hypothetical protein